MKTVCKKLLCLMLVAMMLVSAIPAAFADGTDGEGAAPTSFKVNIKVFLDGEDSGYVKNYTVTEDVPLQFTEDQAMALLTKDNRSFDKWTNASGAELTGDQLTLGWLTSNEKTEGEYYVCVYYNVTEEENQAPESNPTLYNLEFISDYDDTQYVTVEDGDEVDVPAGKDVYQKDFKGWYTGENGTGNRLRDGDVWEEGDPQTYYAYYVSGEGNVSKLRLYVQRYVDGSKHGDPIHLLTQEFSNGENMKDWLNENKTSLIAKEIFEVVDPDEYEWIDRYFYNYWSSEKMTSDDLEADGSKDIFVKVVSTDENTSKVHLYLHKSEDADEFRILKMSGYSAGDYVTRAAVKDKIEDYYKYDSVSNLFTEDDWKELQDDLNNNGRSSVKVEAGDTTIIHVIVKNASSSSKADSSNPKTGDNIMIAVTTMTLAAAALVSMVELKKRKMI